MKPQEVDVIFIGTGIAPLLSAFKCRTAETSFFLLNPLNDFFIEDLELSYDPDWPLTSDEDSFLTYDEQKKIFNEFFPGSIDPFFHKKDHLFIKGKDHELWSSVEASFLKNFDSIKPTQLSETQSSLKFPGLNFKNDSRVSAATLFPKTGVIDVIPFRNELYEFLRENHENQIQTFSHPIKIHPDFIQYTVKEVTHSIKAKKIIIFWSPGISKWFESTMSKLDLKAQKPFKRVTIEDYKIVSKERIESQTIGTLDEFSCHSNDSSKNMLLNILKKSNQNSFFSENSFLEIKNFILDFLNWKTFSIRSIVLKNYSVIEHKKTREKFNLGETTLEVFHAADGPLIRILLQIKSWVDENTL